MNRLQRLEVVAAIVLILGVLLSGCTGDSSTEGAGSSDGSPGSSAGSSGPSKGETQSKTDQTAPSTRLLTYAEGRTIHWGHRSIDTGRHPDSLYVTDNGVAFTTPNGRIWFTDGSSVEQIGSLGADIMSDDPLTYDGRLTVSSGNAGSRLVWLSVTAEGEQSLVVYDAETRAELLRTPTVEHPDWTERLTAVLARTAYTACSGRGDACIVSGADPRRVRYNLATGQRTMVSLDRYQAVLRRHARTLVVGATFASGGVLEGPGVVFRRDGSQMTVVVGGDFIDFHHGRNTLAFVGGSATPIHLRLPKSLADVHLIHVFQWLDDDTIAAWVGGEEFDHGDLLTCRLSTGRCELAVEGSTVDLVPGLPGANLRWSGLGPTGI